MVDCVCNTETKTPKVVKRVDLCYTKKNGKEKAMDKTFNINISLKRALQSGFVVLAVIFLYLVWQQDFIKDKQVSGAFLEERMDIMQSEGVIRQTFIPSKEGLSDVQFYLYNDEIAENGYFLFRLFDAEMKQLDEREIFLEKFSLPGVCKVRINAELIPGEIYYYSLENRGVDLQLAIEYIDSENTPESLGLYFEEVYDDSAAVYTVYTYRNELTAGQKIMWSLGCLVLCTLLIVGIEFLMKNNKAETRFDFGCRAAASVVATIAALWAAWMVFPERKFSTEWVNVVFYETGIFLFLLFALWGLLHKREVLPGSTLQVKSIAEKVPLILQALAFAGIFHGGVIYQNALSVIQQREGKTWVFCCFALVIILSYEKKEIFNWYNAVYGIIAVILGRNYWHQHGDTVENLMMAKWDAYIVILWGFVLLNTIRILIQNKKNKVSWVYLVAFVLLIAEMIRSRNTRTWPIEIAIFWGLFAIRVMYKGQVKRYLYNLTNGLFIQFIFLSINSLLYRPFHYYMYIRYSGVFHTVTFATVYYVLVFGLALARFLQKYRENKSIKKCWKELGILGMAAAFLILTISRTGYLGAIVIAPALLVLTAIVGFKNGLKQFLMRTAILLGCIVSFFVIIFTACRIVPAVKGEPFTYEIEWFVGSIKAGEEWDSKWYVTVPRFFGVAEARVSYYGDEEEITEEEEALGAKTDYSSGRIELYKIYLAVLDWKGHDTIDLKLENGRSTGHAHNSFIQTAYDFGLGAGIFFLIFSICAGIRSIIYYVKNKEELTALIPLTVISVFGISGMVEYVFLPYYPLAFAFLFALVLLLPKLKKKEDIIKVGKSDEKDI